MRFMKGRAGFLFMLLLTMLLIVCAYAKEGKRQTYVPYVQATKKVTPTPVTHSRVTSIDSMSQTKDTVCNQRSDAFIQQWVHLVRSAGATHMTIAVPYDNDCGQDSAAYARRWEQAARADGLHIWWRQVFSEFEAIYGRSFVSQCNSPSQKKCNDYIALTKARIIAQKDLYRAGDVFSVTAEPAASRIRGVNCFGTVCVFESVNGSLNAIPEFNKFLVDGITASKEAFAQFGLGSSVKVYAGGLDAFVAVGYDNPDWGCDSPGKPDILYRQTVVSMGGFVLDHYFDPAGDTMKNLLDTVEGCYPQDRYSQLKFAIGEWGPIVGDNTPGQIAQTFADVRAAGPRFSGMFNYWQGGPAGQESLFSVNGQTLVPTANYPALRTEYLR